MPRFLVTPWRDAAELLRVRDQLYRRGEYGNNNDGDYEQCRQALNTIAAWKRRAVLPHAIDSTAALVDAKLHDDASRNSVLSIRNAYCAAFNRFVTGFCDTVQNSFKKLSMYDMAAELDMPGSFVELRHEATHEELPSLRRLQQATEQALQWLWDHYWSKLDSMVVVQEKQHGDAAVSPAIIEAEIQASLKAYVSSRRTEIKSGKATAKSASSAGHTLARKFVAFNGTNSSYVKSLTLVLARERFIVPSDHKVGDSMDGAYLIWDNLLQRLSHQLPSFLQAFTSRIVDVLAGPSSVVEPKTDGTKAALYEWLMHILTDDAWFDDNAVSKDAIWTSTMTACMVHQSFWCRKMAKTLLRNGDDDFQDSWLPVFEASLAEASATKAAEGTAPQEDVGSVDAGAPEGIEEIVNDRMDVDEGAEVPADTQPRSSETGWKKWQGPWKPTPIGLVPT